MIYTYNIFKLIYTYSHMCIYNVCTYEYYTDMRTQTHTETRLLGYVSIWCLYPWDHGFRGSLVFFQVLQEGYPRHRKTVWLRYVQVVASRLDMFLHLPAQRSLGPIGSEEKRPSIDYPMSRQPTCATFSSYRAGLLYVKPMQVSRLTRLGGLSFTTTG